MMTLFFYFLNSGNTPWYYVPPAAKDELKLAIFFDAIFILCGCAEYLTIQ